MAGQGIINETPTAALKSFSPSRGKFNFGKTKGMLLHPNTGDFLANASLTDTFTAIQALLVHDTPATTCYFLREFDGTAEDLGEGVAFAKRGQLNIQSDEGTYDKLYTLINPYADYQQLVDFVEQIKGSYNGIPVDDASCMKHGRTTTGIVGFEIHEVTLYPPMDAVVGEGAKYQLRIAFKSINDIKRAEHTYIRNSAGVKVDVFNKTSGLIGLEQIELEDGGTTGNGVHKVMIKGAAGEENLVALYPAVGQLLQVGAFSVTLGDGTAVTVSSVALVAEDNVNRYIALTLDQLDYTNGVTGYITLSAPSVIYGYIARYFRANTYTVTLVK